LRYGRLGVRLLPPTSSTPLPAKELRWAEERNLSYDALQWSPHESDEEGWIPEQEKILKSGPSSSSPPQRTAATAPLAPANSSDFADDPATFSAAGDMEP
jgi:hypothetical protein